MVISRREFNRSVGVFGASLMGLPLRLRRPQDPAPRVNGDRLLAHLRELSEFGKTREGGISRVAFSPADIAGRKYALELMTRAGLETRIDAAGNLIGSRPGSDGDLPPIVLGSHIDSVTQGGNYDGQVGSMGAIEVVQTLAERGFVTRHPLEVVLFTNEENGKTGSRAMSGEVEARELELLKQDLAKHSD